MSHPIICLFLRSDINEGEGHLAVNRLNKWMRGSKIRKIRQVGQSSHIHGYFIHAILEHTFKVFKYHMTAINYTIIIRLGKIHQKASLYNVDCVQL